MVYVYKARSSNWEEALLIFLVLFRQALDSTLTRYKDVKRTRATITVTTQDEGQRTGGKDPTGRGGGYSQRSFSKKTLSPTYDISENVCFFMQMNYNLTLL